MVFRKKFKFVAVLFERTGLFGVSAGKLRLQGRLNFSERADVRPGAADVSVGGLIAVYCNPIYPALASHKMQQRRREFSATTTGGACGTCVGGGGGGVGKYNYTSP